MSCKITLQGANKGTKSDSKGYERKDVVWDPTANASWHAKGWRKYTNDPATWDLLPFPIPPRGICYKGGEAYFEPFLPSFLKPPHPGPQPYPIEAIKIRHCLKQTTSNTSKELALLSQGQTSIAHAPTVNLLSLLLNSTFLCKFKCLQQKAKQQHLILLLTLPA